MALLPGHGLFRAVTPSLEWFRRMVLSQSFMAKTIPTGDLFANGFEREQLFLEFSKKYPRKSRGLPLFCLILSSLTFTIGLFLVSSINDWTLHNGGRRTVPYFLILVGRAGCQFVQGYDHR
ncbi:hypothetical protein [Rhizobium sp. AAP43]|uniref:hypothetical protein n=1 Tax=Rhizobium sp. AAP43 TaxID=1523420 RepID=UPI000A75BC90|nr:hypothetical protein [Rhizobium sp. AAP43]